MATSNIITLVLFALGVVGTILMAQHALITNLLKDRWAAHEELHQDLELRLTEREKAHDKIALKVNTLETVCGMRGHLHEGGKL